MKLLEKILAPGLYLLAFILPLQTRLFIRPGELNGGYFEYGTVSVYGTDILLLFILMFALILKINKSRKLKAQNPNSGQSTKSKAQTILFLIAGLNFISLISIFFSAERLVAVQAYVRLTLGMGLFWLVARAEYDRLKLIYAFLAGATVQAMLGIWQFLSQTTFAGKWLGLAAHPAEVGGSSVIETFAGGRWLRAYGGLDHPNMLGGLLAISLLFIIILMIQNHRSRNQIFNPPAGEAGFQFSIFKKFSTRLPARQVSKFLIKQIIFYLLFFIFLTALFFTFSRGAWAGFIVGSIFILAFKLWQWDKSSLRQLFALAAASAVLVGVLFINYQSLATTRLSNNARLEIKSNLERTASYKDGIAIIKDHWLAGVGIGGYTRSLVKLHPNEPSWFYQPTHNVFLLVWAEVGIVGLILFIAVVAYILIFNFQFFPPRRDPAKAVAIFNKFSIFNLSILLTLVIIMLPDHYFWSLHFGVLFFWLIIGLNIKIIESDN